MTSLPLSNDSGAPDSFIYAPLATLACSSMRIENLVRNRFRDLRTKPGAAYWVSAGRSIYPAPEDTRGASDLKVKATSKQVPRVAPAEQGSNMLFAVPSPDKCWFRARLVSSAWHQLNLKLVRLLSGEVDATMVFSELTKTILPPSSVGFRGSDSQSRISTYLYMHRFYYGRSSTAYHITAMVFCVTMECGQ